MMFVSFVYNCILLVMNVEYLQNLQQCIIDSNYLSFNYRKEKYKFSIYENILNQNFD